ncbi:hypothetical protein Dimus_014879 [Dionaea muscipula]
MRTCLTFTVAHEGLPTVEHGCPHGFARSGRGFVEEPVEADRMAASCLWCLVACMRAVWPHGFGRSRPRGRAWLAVWRGGRSSWPSVPGRVATDPGVAAVRRPVRSVVDARVLGRWPHSVESVASRVTAEATHDAVIAVGVAVSWLLGRLHARLHSGRGRRCLPRGAGRASSTGRALIAPGWRAVTALGHVIRHTSSVFALPSPCVRECTCLRVQRFGRPRSVFFRDNRNYL